MRKFILAVVLAALGATLIATSASAFDSHFKVLGKDKSGHRVGHNGFRFRQVLLEPHNGSNLVGGTTALRAGIRATTVRDATPSSALTARSVAAATSGSSATSAPATTASTSPVAPNSSTGSRAR